MLVDFCKKIAIHLSKLTNYIEFKILQSTMSSMTFGQKQFIPTPPDKGSFPLDHEGSCKKTMVKYMQCLYNNNSNNSMCRDEAKDYLSCRMEHGLMAKEDWSKLGFQEDKQGQLDEKTK